MSADEGVAYCLAPCISCKVPFGFDPDKVPSVLIDPSTSWPPAPDDEAAIKRSHREPICPGCAKAANPERARLGYELIPEGDTMEGLLPGNWMGWR